MREALIDREREKTHTVLYQYKVTGRTGLETVTLRTDTKLGADDSNQLLSFKLDS